MYIKRRVDVPSQIAGVKQLVTHNSRTNNNSNLFNLSLVKKTEDSKFDLYFYFNKYDNKFREITAVENKNDDSETIYGSGFSYNKNTLKNDLTLKFNLSSYTINGNNNSLIMTINEDFVKIAPT